MNTSIFLSIRDEVALEGLEGITFEALWTRLEERNRFIKEETGIQLLSGFTFDDVFKNLVYRIVVKEAKSGRVQFFKLPSPRPRLVVFNRKEHFNENTGTLMYDPSLVPEDIYSPVGCVQDGDIRGSCETYKTRVDITQQILALTSYQQFLASDYSVDEVVAVASQKLRAEAMLGINQGHIYGEMKLETYVLLEYIVRKRFYGYLNSSAEVIKYVDRRFKNSFYYYRNDLLRDGWLVQFPVFFYDYKRKLCHSSYVLYLPRFKPTNVNPIDWKVLEIGNCLFVKQQLSTLPFPDVLEKMHELRTGSQQNREQQQQSTSKEQKSTGKKQKSYKETRIDGKKFRDFLRRYGGVFAVKKPEVLPNSMSTEAAATPGRAKVHYEVEYLRPLDRPLTVDDLYFHEKVPAVDEGEEGEEGLQGDEQTIEEESTENKESNFSQLPTKVLRTKFHKLDRYFIERVYGLIESCGSDGCTRPDLIRLLDVPNSLVRSCFKQLISAQLVTASSLQKGRQRVYVYKAAKFVVTPTDATKSAVSVPSFKDDVSKRRLEIILEYIASAKYIDNLFSLRKHVLAAEKQFVNFKIDIRTIFRLLGSLLEANFIRIRCFRLSVAGESASTYSRNAMLIFHNEHFENLKKRTTVAEAGGEELGLDSAECPFLVRDSNSRVLYVNNIVEHLLLRSKFHFFAQQQVDLRDDISVTPFKYSASRGSGGQQQKEEKLFSPTEDSTFELGPLTEDAISIKVEEEEGALANLAPSSNSVVEKVSFAFNPSVSRKLYGGKQSKVERAFALYRYLFYLLVDEKLPENSGPPEYLLPTDWRYYVPKLCRIYTDLKCTLLDVFLYMPVSVFRDVYQITHVVPGLEALLHHRLYQHQLLWQVSPLIRRHLLYNRRSLNAIFELMDWAASFGLLRHFEKRLQFCETINFELVTTLSFPRPLTPISTDTSTPLSPVQYTFTALEDFDNFVEDVEVHLLNRKTVESCPPEVCPFKADLMMHTLYVFGRRASRKRILEPDSNSSESVAKRAKTKKVSPKAKKIRKPKITVEMREAKKLAKEAAKKALQERRASLSGGLRTRLLRQHWTREEDAFLLKCRLASRLLDPTSHFQSCISRTVIAELLAEHVSSRSAAKDADACARRLLLFAKKAHIQRIIAFSLHELQESVFERQELTNLRPPNRHDTEAMVAAFKIILGRILKHRFTGTEFFLDRNVRGDFHEGRNEETTFNLDGQESVKPSLEDVLSRFDIIDVCQLQQTSVFQSDPLTSYDVHHYVRSNLLISTLTSLRFAIDKAAPLTTSPEEETGQVTNLKSFYLRTMFKSLKHFPSLHLQETIVQLIDANLIKRNKKTLKTQQILGYGYRISPAFFHRITRFYKAFDRGEKEKEMNQCGLVVADRNTLYSSLQFAENLSADFIGALDVDIPEREEVVVEEERTTSETTSSKRPIEFLVDVPETFLTVPKEFVLKSSERGRHVSRSLMLSQNASGLLGTKDEEMDGSENENGHTNGSMNYAKPHPIDVLSIRNHDDETMAINHIKVSLTRAPRSSTFRSGYEEALALLKLHSRIFEPTEFFDPTSSSSSDGCEVSRKSTSILAECLLEHFPFKDGQSSSLYSTDNNLRTDDRLSAEQAKMAVEAIRTTSGDEGLGLKWPQLLVAVFGKDHAVSEELQRDLKRFLRFAEERKLLFAVGIVESMWVHREQIRFWLVNSHQNLDSSIDLTKVAAEAKQVCFLPKLWKLPDGRPDMCTLMAYLSAILGHLSFTSPPTMDMPKLRKALEWTLPPVQLQELMDVLVAIDCVRRLEAPLSKIISPTFSQRTTTLTNITSFDDFFTKTEGESLVEMDVEMIEDDEQSVDQCPQVEVTYEAAVDSFSRLTLFYETLQEKMTIFM